MNVSAQHSRTENMRIGAARVGIGGPVGSGKTALIERLIPAFARRNVSLAIVTNDLGLFEAGKLAAWSAGARLVACVVHEGAMSSLATEWRDGKQVWSVSHDGSEGGDTLEVEGTLPEVFEELKAEALAVQAEAEGEPVDHVFDIPLDLAAEVTGFRHDEMGFDDDIAPFTALERVHIA